MLYNIFSLNDHQREKVLILSTNFVKKMYGDQLGEFVCIYWG